MNELRKSVAKTPSITKEAKVFDTLGTVQEGIRMAMRLDEVIKEKEIEKINKADILPKETPIVTANDIIEERRKDEEREFMQDNER